MERVDWNCPELSECSSPPYSTSKHGTGSRAALTREKIWPCDTGDLVPGWSLGGAVVTIVGTYSSSASEVAQKSGGGHSTTAHAPIYAESSCRPRLPWGVVPQQSECGSLCGVISWEGQRWLDPWLHLSRVRETITGICTGSASEILGPLWPTWAESSCRPPLLHCPPTLGRESWCWERGKCTFKENRASLGITLRTFAPATWVQTLIGSEGQWAEGSATSHPSPPLAPASLVPPPPRW